MHFPAAGIFHNIVIVSIDKRYPGHARKIMNAFWGLGQLMFSKTIIVVDKDVDVQNEAEVAWIVGTHYDPERDIQFTRGPVDDLEDASDLPAYGSKMGIDATRKWASEGFTRPWPKRIVTTEAGGAEGRAMWERIRQRMEGVIAELGERVSRGETARRDDARAILDSRDLIAVGVAGRRRCAGAGTARGRRSSACSRFTSTRCRRRCRPRVSARASFASSGRPRRLDAAVGAVRAAARASPAARRSPGFRSPTCSARRAGHVARRVLRGAPRGGARSRSPSCRSICSTTPAPRVDVRARRRPRRLAADRACAVGRRADRRRSRRRPRSPDARSAASARSRRCRATMSVADADDRVRRREAGRAGAAARRQHRVDPGGLAALRPEARAGRADDGRRRRRRRGGGRSGRCSARGGARSRRSAATSGRRRWSRSRRNAPLSRPIGSAMTDAIRLGAVDYLNARPLVYGLELRTDLFSLRFDVPSKCAALLHEGVDRRRHDSVDRIPARARRTASSPASAIASDGPVASVALFTTRPLDRIRIDCRRHQLADVERAAAGAVRASASASSPAFVPMAPDPDGDARGGATRR